MEKIIKNHLQQCANLYKVLASDFKPTITKIASIVAKSLKDGGKVLICGNGGSAADAQHLAAELMVRLRSDFPRKALPAISLSTDTSVLTACSNDFGYENIFSRQVEGLGRANDILLAITTSGNSPNVVKAIETAKKHHMKVVLFSGPDGGKGKPLADISLLIPSNSTMRIQEAHITVGHILVELIEEQLFNKNVNKSTGLK